MEKSFDFGRLLLKNNAKKHKSKPTQFVSVAGGTKKRLETDIKNRKSVRLTVFDSIRDLPKCESPATVSVAQAKVEHRRQQLEKWKEEKEQKRKEMAAQKKKPFLTGVARAPLKFVPPPPPPKPSTSGRVTRSQTKKIVAKPKPKSPVKSNLKSRQTQSFAPKDATFKPPQFKNLPKMPLLAPPSKGKKKASMVTFDPVVPNTVPAKTTRSRPLLTRQNAIETKVNNKPETRNTRSKFTTSNSTAKFSVSTQSSSDSDAAGKKVTKRIKTPAKKFVKGAKPLPPKAVNIQTDSSSDSTMKKSVPLPSRKSVFTFYSSSDQLSSEISVSSPEKPSIKSNTRKSVLMNFSPRTVSSGRSTDRISTDVEFIEDTTPVKPSRKSLPCTPKNKSVPKSESSSEEKLRSPKVSVELPLTPEQMEVAKMSPCVTMSRGKDNARKEMKWKIDEGYLDDDVSDIDSIDHFRHQLSSEIKRLTEMCNTWDKISAQTVLPESVQEAVLSAVGQARLLMSQRLQQFATLVERCARPEPGSTLVTPTDLQGFWDMVFIQVENVDMRFKKLEELRARNWADEAAAPLRVRKAPSRAASKTDNKPKPAAHSRIRDMIAAARKAKKEQSVDSNPSSDLPLGEGEKAFDAGFFTVRSPIKTQSPRVATPNKTTLLKAVLSSEAKKASSKNTTPFAMLRASIMAKDVECDGVAPLPQTPQMTPVNLFATPGRGILKSTNAKQATQSERKSAKTVLFNQSESDLNQSFSSEITSDKYETPLELTLKDVPQDKENLGTSVRTRNQMKSMPNTPNTKEVITPRRSSRNKKEILPVEVKSNEINKETVNTVEKRRRSSRKKALEELEANILEGPVPSEATPKRSSRRSKALDC